MPYKRRFRKRRRRFRRRRATLAKMNYPVPMRKIVKMRYAENFNLNPSLATTASQVFRCNNILDPNYTGTGHQPLGHDQWAAFYRRYRVLGARCTITGVPSSSGAAGAAIVSLLTSYDPTSDNTIETSNLERDGTSFTTLGALGSSNGFRLWKNWSAKKTWGKEATDSDKSAIFGASPDRGYYFLFHTAALDPGADQQTISCTAVIDYIVELSEPIELLQS